MDEVLNNEVKPRKKQKVILNKEQFKNFQYFDISIPISIIIRELNKLNTNEDMFKLSAKNINNWLISIGVLYESEIKNKKYKLPTD